MLRPTAALRPPHKPATQTKKKRPRPLDAVGVKAAGGAANGSKIIKKKKAAALAPSFLVSGRRRQNEEDMMLGLLEEMGASMTQGGDGGVEEEEETEAPMRPSSSSDDEEEEEEEEEAEEEEEDEEEEEEEQQQKQQQKQKVPTHPSSSVTSTATTTARGVSPHELWNPTLSIDKATLNLPWWGSSSSSSSSSSSAGGSGKGILALPPPPAPPLPPLHPHVEVARAQGIKELGEWFVGAALRQGNAAAAAVSSMSMTGQQGKVVFLRRAFQAWMQDNKLREKEEKEGGKGVAIGGAEGKRRLVLTDPVLPQTAACQRDLGSAKALTGDMVGLSAGSFPVKTPICVPRTKTRPIPSSLPPQINLRPETAVELCEALGIKALALVSSLHQQQQNPASLPSSVPSSSTLSRKQSRLDQPPVLRSRHHAPCLYLPLSSLSDARLTLLERNEALDLSLLKGHALRINEKHYQKLKVEREGGRGASKGGGKGQMNPRYLYPLLLPLSRPDDSLPHFQILYLLTFLLTPLQTLYTKQHLSRGPPRLAHKNRHSSSSSSSSAAPSSSLAKAEEDLFHERLGCLLFRYQALAAAARNDPSTPSSSDADEADERSLPPRVFDALVSLFGAQMECFASPFNCRYSVFCSSQWDLDGYFGSVGSFFAFRPLDGMYVAHPPPVPGVVEGMFKVSAREREEGGGETWVS